MAVADSFERIEEKYILQQSQLPDLLAALSKQLPASYPDQSTQFNSIQSIYFESPDLKFFSDHLRGSSDRYKLRVRTYFPNGTNTSLLVRFLEIKHKCYGLSKKRRIRIDENHFHLLMEGEALMWNSVLKSLNPQMSDKKLSSRIIEINKLIEAFSLKPMLKVSYERSAFEKDNLRVTVDTNLKYEYLNQHNAHDDKTLLMPYLWSRASGIRLKFSNLENIIVEIKHQRNIPFWLRCLMLDQKSQSTDFSKFCWSLYERASALSRPEAPNLSIRQFV